MKTTSQGRKLLISSPSALSPPWTYKPNCQTVTKFENQNWLLAIICLFWLKALKCYFSTFASFCISLFPSQSYSALFSTLHRQAVIEKCFLYTGLHAICLIPVTNSNTQLCRQRINGKEIKFANLLLARRHIS